MVKQKQLAAEAVLQRAYAVVESPRHVLRDVYQRTSPRGDRQQLVTPNFDAPRPNSAVVEKREETQPMLVKRWEITLPEDGAARSLGVDVDREAIPQALLIRSILPGGLLESLNRTAAA